MSKHVNMLILLGNVGADPKIGNGVVRFRLATNRSWKDRDGVKQERTTWTTCVAFGKLGDIVGKYVQKGSLVHVRGYTESREYEKDGIKREAYEMILEDLVLLSKAENESSTPNRSQDSRNQTPANNRPSSNRSDSSAPQQGGGSSDGGFDDSGFDDYPL